MAIWRKATKARGVGLYVHYSGVWDSVAVEHHPEWARVDAEGKPDRNATSTFGPYCKELLIPQLKEAVDAYDLDGVWVDGDCWAVQPDFAPNATAAFRQATGVRETPKKRGDPHWLDFLDFQRTRFKEYVRTYADALHVHKPGFQVTSNWMYSSLVPEPVTVPIDFISGDYSPGDSVNSARFEARYMASVGMPWDLMAWGFNKGEDCDWALKMAVQLKQEASIVLAQGGGFQIYYNPTRAGWIDGWMTRIMAEVAGFCRERQSFSHRTETIPQVALLLSRASLYERSDRLFGPWGHLVEPVHGMLHALLELHYSVDVLAEHQLSDRLTQYPVVVLPECHILPATLRSALHDYAQEGGSLLAVGAETVRLFENSLGVTLTGEPAETRAAHLQAGEALAWAGGLWQNATPTIAQIIGTRYATYDTRHGGLPAATVAPLGRGKVTGIYGPIGSIYQRSHHPVLRRFIAEAMRALFPKPLVELDGPPCVDVALRRKGDCLVVHLANTGGAQTAPRYSVTDFVPSVDPLRLKVRVVGKTEDARLEPGGQALSVNGSGEEVYIDIPRLDVHSAIVITR